jgi:tetratricopeptide (TPR) repeat protein
LLLVLAGCAAGRATRINTCADSTGLAIADSLVRQGCLECLLEARRAYERQASGCPAAHLQRRLFETQLLVVVRERELGIDDGPSTAVARQLAAALPATASSDRYLSLAAAIRPDSEGLDDSQFPRPREEYVRAELTWLTRSSPASILDEYLSVALACELPSPDLPDANAVTVPLLQYRQALCGKAVNVPAMQQVRTREARFDEASFFVARASFSADSSSDHRETLRMLTLARERFPASAAAAYQLAAVADASGRCDRAEQYYADTLELFRDHQGARLGRAICLSRLGRHAEAIDDATIVVDAGLSRAGEALYWRALSHYRTQSLVDARADIDKAKTAHRTPATLMLAGLIELEQSDLGLAHDDLQDALRSSPAFCQARWQLGVVDFRRQDFTASADAFAAAATCYAEAQASTRDSLATVMARADLDVGFRAQRVSALQEEAHEFERGRDSSVLNAALNYARAGNRERAQAYLRQAGPTAPRDVVAEVARVLANDERPTRDSAQPPR